MEGWGMSRLFCVRGPNKGKTLGQALPGTEFLPYSYHATPKAAAERKESAAAVARGVKATGKAVKKGVKKAASFLMKPLYLIAGAAVVIYFGPGILGRYQRARAK
jgi:hypothetical protein